jgi:hypothetical protein
MAIACHILTSHPGVHVLFVLVWCSFINYYLCCGTNELVSFSLHVLFILFIIDYIFHYISHSRLHVLVCWLTVKIY